MKIRIRIEENTKYLPYYNRYTGKQQKNIGEFLEITFDECL